MQTCVRFCAHLEHVAMYQSENISNKKSYKNHVQNILYPQSLTVLGIIKQEWVVPQNCYAISAFPNLYIQPPPSGHITQVSSCQQ
jgi:hypothetical protein